MDDSESFSAAVLLLSEISGCSFFSDCGPDLIIAGHIVGVETPVVILAFAAFPGAYAASCDHAAAALA